jgi:hypothetical protein
MSAYNNDAPQSEAEVDEIRREAARHGLTVTKYLMMKAAPTSLVQDIVNDFRGGATQPSSIMPQRDRAGPAVPGSGWQKERPLRAPEGVDLIDRMCATADAVERIQTAHERAKVTLDLRAYELQQEQEREARRRDHELDPCNTGIYKSKDELDRGE